MYAIVAAIIIVFTMLFLVILRSRKYNVKTLFLKKSELSDIIDSIPDDAVIQLLIGRNSKCKTPPK